MSDEPRGPEKEVIDDPPPFCRTWGRVYMVVIAYLAVLIIVFWAFTRAFVP
jgi:hypothetical protein